MAWFAKNTLPEHIRYYSVIAFPDPENISNALQRFHRQLGELKDARNDSQVVFYDQVIPGSTVLEFFNADHWAISVPIARQHEITQAVFADQNDFPREIVLEDILRCIEEDLATAAADPDGSSTAQECNAALTASQPCHNLGWVQGQIPETHTGGLVNRLSNSWHRRHNRHFAHALYSKGVKRVWHLNNNRVNEG